MSESKLGTVVWTDLTVPNAEEVRDFYMNVVGWTFSGMDMDGYEDFVMTPPVGTEAVGICFERGANKGTPPVWMIYVAVPDVESAMQKVEANGGKVLRKPKEGSSHKYAVIQDPAGAIMALFETAE